MLATEIKVRYFIVWRGYYKTLVNNVMKTKEHVR